MSEQELQSHLSQIHTDWTLLFQAHEDSSDSARKACQVLLLRYSGAVYRYLRALVGDEESAAELVQDFALHFLRGDFKNVDPSRGQFRSYVKTMLVNLVRRFRRTQTRPLQEGHSLDEVAQPALEPADAAENALFLQAWRDELLARTWEALGEFDTAAGTHYALVLRLRTEHPELSSEQLAGQLQHQLKKTLASTAVRQLLHRAREKFSDLFVAEVAHSLGKAERDILEDELGQLGVLEQCRDALARRQSG